jgi:hypothetical protein
MLSQAWGRVEILFVGFEGMDGAFMYIGLECGQRARRLIRRIAHFKLDGMIA